MHSSNDPFVDGGRLLMSAPVFDERTRLPCQFTIVFMSKSTAGFSRELWMRHSMIVEWNSQQNPSEALTASLSKFELRGKVGFPKKACFLVFHAHPDTAEPQASKSGAVG